VHFDTRKISVPIWHWEGYNHGMFIYDSTSLAFIQRTEKLVREILQTMGFRVQRNRFFWNNYLYPIRVVVFEGNELGHFNAPFYQIGLNRKLIYSAKDSVLRDILCHELAHYITFLKFGEVLPHGNEFKAVCKEFGFSPEISSATINLLTANENKEGDLQSERVIEKVKKLLQLAHSSNVHEAELATLKANELLLRHNLDQVSAENETVIYLERVLIRSRKDTKLTAIYDILRHFIVRPVISQGKGQCCIEVSGTLTNVKLAHYVAEFLDRELDHLWELAKKEFGLTGLRAKNSFFIGVAKGFDDKMKLSKSALSTDDKRSLVLVEQRLDEATASIYRRLSQSYSNTQIDEAARGRGVESGRNLTIRKGVEKSSGKTLYLT
jgi:predicted metal-dependent hydrolase